MTERSAFKQIFDLPVAFQDSAGNIVMSIEEGGAEKGVPSATIYLQTGDILVRNVQGGGPTSPNLDVGAGGSGGDTGERGNVSSLFDTGNGHRFYDGHGRLLLSLNEHHTPTGRAPYWDKEVHIRSTVRLHDGAKFLVPDGRGGYRPAQI